MPPSLILIPLRFDSRSVPSRAHVTLRHLYVRAHGAHFLHHTLAQSAHVQPLEAMLVWMQQVNQFHKRRLHFGVTDIFATTGMPSIFAASNRSQMDVRIMSPLLARPDDATGKYIIKNNS